jgi:hypothetical protein
MIDFKEFWDEFDREDSHSKDDINIKLDNHPYICIGTFYKTVLESKNMSNFIFMLFPAVEDKNDFFENLQKYFYNKAFNNLNYIDFSSEYHINEIHKHPKTEIIQAINILIPIFENSEEYEKCSILKKLESVL